jgi:hypothetical protein
MELFDVCILDGPADGVNEVRDRGELLTAFSFWEGEHHEEFLDCRNGRENDSVGIL